MVKTTSNRYLRPDIVYAYLQAHGPSTILPIAFHLRQHVPGEVITRMWRTRLTARGAKFTLNHSTAEVELTWRVASGKECRRIYSLEKQIQSESRIMASAAVNNLKMTGHVIKVEPKENGLSRWSITEEPREGF